MDAQAHRNRLASEPSLYLQQHAANPVDWYPWGAEALARARLENKPILLSIGYSACHWCHVMERESFENTEIARLMNELFVCIKVDREERPDLDSIYMKAVQGMTGHGGWPMTVFLTPDGRPFYAGTYFPPEERGGMPGFPRVLAAVAQAFRDQPEKVRENADRVLEFLTREHEKPAGVAAVSTDRLRAAADRLTEALDTEHGGFGGGPKFPATMCLSFLAGVERWAPDEKRRARVRTALDRMADGGIYDHVGGGFHRYSVDRLWLVPHFEKMLYDQAQLASLYTEASKLFGSGRYRDVALGVLDYVAREMTSPAGGYYSTQDADSEGVEGKYFVWTTEELADVLGERHAWIVCQVFGASSAGNFEGANILHRRLTDAQAATACDLAEEELRRIVQESLAKLRRRRERRVKPARDEKILTDWNGLMLGTMATAGRLFGRDDLVRLARRSADFCLRHMSDGDRLKHLYANGSARVDGFLDDYAFFGRGCLELFFAAGRKSDLDSAERCAGMLLERFEDREGGGFYFTSSDGEQLVARTRDLHDGPVPSGNSVAAELLLRLHQLTGDDRYRTAGERVLGAFLEEASGNPYGGAHLLCVADRYRRRYVSVVVVGAADEQRAVLAASARDLHAPEVSVVCTEEAETSGVAVLAGKKGLDGRAAAYVCRGPVCSPPVTTASELRAALTDGSMDAETRHAERR